MKTFKRNLMTVLLTIGFMGISVIAAKAQGDQDFLLVNKTGVEIYAMHVTPHSADDWGDDILGVDTLLSNESAEITFSPQESAKFWDLRVEDEEGNFIVWTKLNLLEISTVTLYYNNGKATAVVD